MAEAYSRKTKEYIPRDICLCYSPSGSNSKFYFSPFAHVLGGLLRVSPAVTKRRLADAQEYNVQFEGEKASGKSRYEKLFPWPQELLDVDTDGLFGMFRDAVVKKEGSGMLVNAGPAKALRDITLKGRVLTARAKSKSPRGGIHGYYDVGVDSPLLTPSGYPDLKIISCQCSQYMHDTGEKGGRNHLTFAECLHDAALIDENAERISHPNPRKKAMVVEGVGGSMLSGSEPLSPFAFVQNWTFDSRNGVYKPLSQDLGMLETDMLVSYFFGKGGSYFDINRNAFRLAEIYSPQMLRWLREGMMRREVVSHGPKHRKVSANELAMENHVFDQTRRLFRDQGFKYNGRFLEFGRSAWCYDKGSMTLGIFLDENGIFYTVRDRTGMGDIDPTRVDHKCQDPFAAYGWRSDGRRYSDLHMADTAFRLEIPTAPRISADKKAEPIVGAINVPDLLKRKWKKQLLGSEGNHSEKIDETKLKRARLFYGAGD